MVRELSQASRIGQLTTKQDWLVSALHKLAQNAQLLSRIENVDMAGEGQIGVSESQARISEAV